MATTGKQQQERHDTAPTVEPAAIERDVRDLHAALGKERFVSRLGRAQWARGVDESAAVTHRQVFRSIGGVLGKVKRAVVSFGQDGAVRTRARAAVTTYSDAEFTAEERRSMRRNADHYRVADDVEADD